MMIGLTMNYRLGLLLLLHGGILLLASSTAGAAVPAVVFLRQTQEDSSPASAPAATPSCFVCPGGGTITNPNGEVLIPGQDMQTCSELADTVGKLSSTECDLIQTVTSIICGCTSSPTMASPTRKPSVPPSVSRPTTSSTGKPVVVPTVAPAVDVSLPDPSTSPTMSPVALESDPPSSSPTINVSAAPTVDGILTLYITIFAERPQNIGWHIGDEFLEEIRVAVPFDAYLPSQTEVRDRVTVVGGQSYQFAIKSKFGDDLGEDGSYQVKLGDEVGGQILAGGTGNFGLEEISVFNVSSEIDLPHYIIPSFAPTTLDTVNWDANSTAPTVTPTVSTTLAPGDENVTTTLVPTIAPTTKAPADSPASTVPSTEDRSSATCSNKRVMVGVWRLLSLSVASSWTLSILFMGVAM